MSRFTYRDLYNLKTPEKSFDSPMACIVHVDMDAFFAQVEQVRLGLPPDTPVACRQWDGLIAVGYAARSSGITRHMRAPEAQKLCPELVMAHAASFKRGEDMWAYHPHPTADDYKISLDPYRQAGKKVLNIIKQFSSVVEKASVDESYLDLGPRIFNEIMIAFPQLQLLDNDLDNFLPEPPRSHELKIRGYNWDNLGVLEIVTDISRFDPEIRVHDGTQVTDWDDLVLMFGARITNQMRAKVHEELKYTCSAGVARCRSVAKLASAQNKPNNQTIVRAGALMNYLKKKSLTDIGGMGGKLGEEVLEKLGLDKESKDNITQIQAMSKQQLQQKLQNAALTEKVHNLSRGSLYRGLKTRIELKSMLSAKNFSRVPLKDRKEAELWLVVFAGELSMRIVEHEKELGLCRRPKTVSLQHVRFKPTVKRSRQQDLPLVHTNKLKEELFSAGLKLLKQIESEPEHDAYPISMLSLSVSGFVDLPAGASIGHFFKTITSEAREKAVEEKVKSQQVNTLWNKPKEKKESSGKDITQFFSKKPKEKKETDAKQPEPSKPEVKKPARSEADDYNSSSLFVFSDDEMDEYIDTFTCEKCDKKYPVDEEMEHSDWHVAVELSKASRPEPKPLKVVKPKGKGNGQRQTKLAF
ncbi:N-acetyltransferase eso1 [Yarrowia sp. B02]|nr:N-acetyltransferase eso1 [Yarrowia sp. B02]